ncbi:hypothetical protein H2201_005070 [Coniosporium apollinis]|uniref:histidine kinase n=1 Tax=Coniosporium apollinis TaxID=61459 RepID=A0ABQ9NUB1_9PEZI|nr:hypothetical protein H2201_005070 [Coniosporium apollinis]
MSRYYNPRVLPPTEDARKAKPPPDSSTGSTISHDALTAFTQVVSARLGVLGAFVTLTDGSTQHLIAGSADNFEDHLDAGGNVTAAAWFNEPGATEGWLLLARRTLERSPGPATQRCFCIPDLTVDEYTKTLSSVTEPPSLRFYAAAPIITRLDICIGALFVVHDSARQELLEQEAAFLQDMAKKCVRQLEMAREVEAKRRGLKMSEGIDSFIQHRETGVPDASAETPSPQSTESNKKFTPGSSPQSQSVGKSTNIPQDRRPPEADEDSKVEPEQPPSSSQQARKGHGHDAVHGETTYRKTFKRAAACLRNSLEVDGVMFVDGFVGFHGGLLPVGEPELELEREMTQIQKGKQTKDAAMNSDTSNEGARIFTSADYTDAVYTHRAAEILGCAIQQGRTMPPTTQLTESTKGLTRMDEGFLQHFLERHSEGRTWYSDEAGKPFRFDGDALISAEDQFEDANHMFSCFPGARQVIMSPLTDPVTLKHLAGCFAWTYDVFPVLTDGTDLTPNKSFLHTVVAEISRLDSVAAVKQQASFVSSVSHELRSPLHGILGAAELLAETHLDHFQKGLADVIRSCGSTLRDTLSNVLSYAKINDFEQKQNRAQQNRPSDSPWALENKAQEAVRQDGSSSGLYVSTDIAMLCEDIVQVLESGRSYSTSTSDTAPTVTLNIAYHEAWVFVTEPGALRRIMMNIIGNAMKYSPNGVVVVSLDVRDAKELEPQDEARPELRDENGVEHKIVVFTAKDTGKGMSKDFVENRLFLPFHQEDAMKSEGVGLGMSIVKSLVSLLAGKIEVKSQVGEGSEFKVNIPMAPGKVTQQESGAPTIEQSLTILRSKNLNVAIYGFEHTIAWSLRAYLVDWFNCTVVPLGDEESHPDIVIADGTRNNTFEEICTQLRAYRRRLAVLTICTGPPKPASSKYVAEKHIWEGISRPFGPNKLSKALLRCLERLQDLDQSETETNGFEEQQQQSPSSKRSYSRASIDTTCGSATADRNTSQEHSSEMRFLAASQINTTATLTTKSGPSMLLVEDNVVNLKLLNTFMSKKGYMDVETAVDGLQAVQAVERRTEGFDIIITDISMPVMDGFEASRRIRELERERGSSASSKSRKPALLVALTGLASANDRDEALRSGVDIFMPKPVRFEKLRELLAQWKREEISGGSGIEAGSENKVSPVLGRG